MSAHQRTKGKRGELEVAELMSRLLRDPSINRNLDQTREGGYDLNGKALQYFAVEVKRAAVPRLVPWFNVIKAEQVSRATNHIPCLLWRPDRGDWRAFLELDVYRLTHYIRFINALRGDDEPLEP